MKNLYEKAIIAYINMLKIHINTKTKDNLFHKETENFYLELFNIAHLVWEKHVDLWDFLQEKKLSDEKKDVYEIISNLKEEIERYKEKNKVSLGTEDLLWSLSNSLENLQWTAKSFISNEK